jgi:hypothetical protein
LADDSSAAFSRSGGLTAEPLTFLSIFSALFCRGPLTACAVISRQPFLWLFRATCSAQTSNFNPKSAARADPTAQRTPPQSQAVWFFPGFLQVFSRLSGFSHGSWNPWFFPVFPRLSGFFVVFP